MTERFGGHKCKTCGTKFDGKGSLQRAKECKDLGQPNHKFQIGQIVVIGRGNRKGPKWLVITKQGYARRAVRKKGKVVSAQHTCTYRLKGAQDGKYIKGWPYFAEYKLKVVYA